MSNPQALIQTLQDTLEELSEEVNRLQDEVDRMESENDQLRRENKSLREEVTVARLYQEMSQEEDEMTIEYPVAMPPDALELYRSLPSAFKFAEFFKQSDEQGLDSATARDTLLYFLREELLIQRGARIEKAEQRKRSFNIEEHMQPSRL